MTHVTTITEKLRICKHFGETKQCNLKPREITALYYKKIFKGN